MCPLQSRRSSDHIATHNSYACVWAESLDRRALVEGMKKRHSYAATDNIVLDVRSGNHIMGDEFSTTGPITLDVNILGTAPLSRAEIIRSPSSATARPPRKTVQAPIPLGGLTPTARPDFLPGTFLDPSECRSC